jgi:hypothetical protein
MPWKIPKCSMDIQDSWGPLCIGACNRENGDFASWGSRQGKNWLVCAIQIASGVSFFRLVLGQGQPI